MLAFFATDVSWLTSFMLPKVRVSDQHFNARKCLSECFISPCGRCCGFFGDWQECRSPSAFRNNASSLTLFFCYWPPRVLLLGPLRGGYRVPRTVYGAFSPAWPIRGVFPFDGDFFLRVLFSGRLSLIVWRMNGF